MTEQPDRQLPRWVGTVAVALLLAGMVVWSFAQRWDVLSASPFPLGVDGYFYPVQLRSLLESGELQYPASPLAFWLLAPFAAATDPITGAKLGAAVLGALVAWPAYAVGAQLGRSDGDGRGPGLVAAAIATSSAGSMYMTIEFVKNGIGLTVALTALWLVLRCFDAPTRWRIAAAAVGVVAAVLAHKMAAAIVIGIAIPAVGVELHTRGVLGRRIAIGFVAIAVASAGVLLLVGVIAPRRFLSPSDLALLDGLFTGDAEWSLPVLRSGKLRMSYEPLIAVVVAIGAAALLIVERRRQHVPAAKLRTRERAGADVVAWAIVGLALVIGWPWLDVSGPQGLGMRLRLIAFVPLALCAAIVLRAGLRHVVREPGQRFGACIAIAIAVIALRVGGEPRTEGQVVTHPALISASQALVGRIPDGDVAIVPERHIAFMVAWYARARISMRPEPIAAERRWRVMPLAFIRRNSASFDATLTRARERPDLTVIGLHPSHMNGMVLLGERTWQAVMEMLPEAERARLEAWPTI